jgi:hypothetical protein
MDQKSIAVAVIHGTGYKDPDFAEDISRTLQDRFPTHLPEEARSRADLSIQPVYWADLPREREEEVWDRVTSAGDMGHLGIRRFIFNVAGDTLAYQPSEGRKELYMEVHRTMAESFETLAEKAGSEAPLCVIAHSVGSVVAHNYLYDMQHEGTRAGESEDALADLETALERGETLALFVTYGNPLAIWRLRFGDEYKSIRFPGNALEERYPAVQPKWLNIYDENDVLGYPISRLTERYKEMAEDGYLEDREMDVGKWYKSWNPLSHKGYLRDESSLDELAGFIADIWQGAYGSS